MILSLRFLYIIFPLLFLCILNERFEGLYVIDIWSPRSQLSETWRRSKGRGEARMAGYKPET